MGCWGMKRLIAIGLSLLMLVVSALHAEDAGINDYDYFKPAWMGKEKLIMPAYRGVPAKTRRLMKRAITQSYKALGKRPIANTYALYWHTKKSNLTKVAKKWCAVRRIVCPKSIPSCEEWSAARLKRCLTEVKPLTSRAPNLKNRAARA